MAVSMVSAMTGCRWTNCMPSNCQTTIGVLCLPLANQRFSPPHSEALRIQETSWLPQDWGFLHGLPRGWGFWHGDL